MAKKKEKRNKGSVDKERYLRKLGVTYARELTDRATSWEIEFRQKLEEIGVVYCFQYPVVCERNFLYILDFYLPDHELAFELDGAHHYQKDKFKADNLRSKRILALGIKVKRIMNANVKQVTPAMLRNYLDTTKLLKNK